ncbi:MAG: ABC transporter substrate-binding protein, partial [Actinomycetota bacterium]|nr:ABC transporter substrate-binding protein [Actinomycetota bacterium]
MIEPRARAMVVANAAVLLAAILSVGQVRFELDKHDSLADGSQVGLDNPSASTPLPGQTLAPRTPPTTAPGSPQPGASAVPGQVTRPGVTTPRGVPTTLPRGVSLPDFGLLDQGVTKTSVLLGADYDKTGCGGSGQLANQFGAAVVGDPEKATAAFVRHINETGGIRGRTLKVVTVDDGGLYCPERHQAAALELVDQKKVFLDMAGLHEVSDLLAKRHLPFWGGRATIAEQNKQGDGQFQLYQDADGDFANWAAFGRNYLKANVNAPCLIHPDTPDFNNLEKVLNVQMAKQGLKFKLTIRYADDPSTAQYQATNAAVKMKPVCKSVWLVANNALADVFFTNAAYQQQWFPTWTWTARTGGIDFATFSRLMQQDEWKNSIGLSTRIKPGVSPYDRNCAKIYDKYHSGDGQNESAA